MAEIPFEKFGLALESVRGTAITTPTITSTTNERLVTPRQERYTPEVSLGNLVEFYKSIPVQQRVEWSISGAADLNLLFELLKMAVEGSPTITTPGTDADLAEFTPDSTSDTIKSATLVFGDPGVQLWSAAYCMVDTLTLSSDATGTDGLTMEASGQGQWWSEEAGPISFPAVADFPLIAGTDMQIWIDTSSAIGTTAVTGRFLSATHEINTGVTYKYVATGPTGDKTFSTTGRRPRSITTTLRFEVPDLTQYNYWKDAERLKVRVRHNGPLIETVSTTDYYHFVQVDTYGEATMLEWGTYQDSNRTIELTVQSMYDTTLQNDFEVDLQTTELV
jgi:hypothetical protein